MTGVQTCALPISNPELWAIVNGKLYTFSSQKAKETVLESPALIAQAHKNWVTMK